MLWLQLQGLCIILKRLKGKFFYLPSPSSPSPNIFFFRSQMSCTGSLKINWRKRVWGARRSEFPTSIPQIQSFPCSILEIILEIHLFFSNSGFINHHDIHPSIFHNPPTLKHTLLHPLITRLNGLDIQIIIKLVSPNVSLTKIDLLTQY